MVLSVMGNKRHFSINKPIRDKIEYTKEQMDRLKYVKSHSFIVETDKKTLKPSVKVINGNNN